MEGGYPIRPTPHSKHTFHAFNTPHTKANLYHHHQASSNLGQDLAGVGKTLGYGVERASSPTHARAQQTTSLAPSSSSTGTASESTSVPCSSSSPKHSPTPAPARTISLAQGLSPTHALHLIQALSRPSTLPPKNSLPPKHSPPARTPSPIQAHPPKLSLHQTQPKPYSQPHDGATDSEFMSKQSRDQLAGRCGG